MAKSIPEGYHAVTPYLTVHDANAAIDFYKRAFGAEEMLRMDAPEGKVMHAEIRIDDSVIMLADEFPEWGNTSPQTLGGTGSSLMLYVDDVDAVFDRAVREGAKSRMPVEDQFYGDRSGQVEDPFGHRWSIATAKEQLTPEQMGQRFKEWQQRQQAPST